jgi:hypothetical protein
MNSVHAQTIPALRLLLLALLALILVGCMEVETLVKVNPDGSGQVEERFLMGSQLSAMAAGLGSTGEGSSAFNKRELSQRASEMGKGVELASAEAIQEGGRQGYLAVFAFDDINELRINQNPSDKAAAPGMEQQTVEEFITFQFTPGDPAELKIISPEPEFTPEEDAADKGGMGGMGDADPAMLGMMKEMFKDMRIAMAIEVNGEIQKTNAAYQQGNRLTLMELDFGKLVGDMENFKALAQANPQSVAEAQELTKGMEGIKVQLEPELLVRFGKAAE